MIEIMNIAISSNFFSSLLTLRSIVKICDSVSFLEWERIVFENLKWTHLWKYIELEVISKNATLAKQTKWIKDDDQCRIVLRIVVKSDLYLKIMRFVA